MIKGFPQSMVRLIDDFCKMPGIGKRSAQRLAFHVLSAPGGDVDSLIKHISEVKGKIEFCKKCNNLSDKELCWICSDTTRDNTRVCVVENPSSVIAIEKSGFYRGVYHVLLGELSPIDGTGPDELKINELIERVKKNKIKEVILATDFTTEGETTALYLVGVLKQYAVKVTRLAHGVPVGASVEYADVATLQRAFEDRLGVK